MNKCLIYEGVFDPPHIGHQKLLKSAICELKPDIVVVMVATNEAARELSNKPRASLQYIRKLLCEKTFVDLPITVYVEGDNRFIPKFNIDIIKYVMNKYSADRYYYLMGTDRINSISKYHASDEIKRLTIAYYPEIHIESSIRSTMIRKLVKENKNISPYVTPFVESLSTILYKIH